MTRRASCFTLVEVCIASLILAGMTVALFAFSAYVTNAWQSLQIRRNQLNELLAVDRAVEAMLPNMIPFDWPDPDAETITEAPVLLAEADTLRFAYLHRLNDLEEGAIRFVQLFVENGELVAQYSDRPLFNWDAAGDRVWKTTLAQNVDAVEFSYADWEADITTDDWAGRLKWTDYWDNVEVERYDVPLAVRMTVHWQDGRAYTWLRRTMGNGYRERFGKWEAQDLE